MAKKYFTKGKQVLLTNFDDASNSDDEGQIHVEHLDKVIQCQVEMHHDCEIEHKQYYKESGHYIYITPQLFENFIRTYKKLIKRREVELNRHRDRFRRGYEGINKCLKKTEETQEKLS